jgi:hypothetical protein
LANPPSLRSAGISTASACHVEVRIAPIKAAHSSP